MGWIGNALLIYGTWRLAYKERSALLFGIAGSIAWAIQAVITDQWDLLFIEITLGVLQANVWLKWGKST